MSEHTCLNVIFIPVFCQKINFFGVCAWAEHMVVDLWRWQPIWAIAPYGLSSPPLADALGFSTIKWRSSLFSLSTAVPCTLKCFVNHCLPSTEAAKTLIKFEFWDVMLEWWNFIPVLDEWNWLWKDANEKSWHICISASRFTAETKMREKGEKKAFLLFVSDPEQAGLCGFLEDNNHRVFTLSSVGFMLLLFMNNLSLSCSQLWILKHILKNLLMNATFSVTGKYSLKCSMTIYFFFKN